MGRQVVLLSCTCAGVCYCVVQVMTKLSFMTPPAAADLRRENIEYVSGATRCCGGRRVLTVASWSLQLL